MTLTRPTTRGSIAQRFPRRVLVLPVGVLLLVLALAGVAAMHRAWSPQGRWPQRISVDGRTYDRSGLAAADEVRSTDAGWQQVATAGPDDNPVYALPIGGAAPTVVIVQTSINRYVEYVLVGGP